MFVSLQISKDVTADSKSVRCRILTSIPYCRRQSSPQKYLHMVMEDGHCQSPCLRHIHLKQTMGRFYLTLCISSLTSHREYPNTHTRTGTQTRTVAHFGQILKFCCSLHELVFRLSIKNQRKFRPVTETEYKKRSKP